ncbi:hypothetical protein GC177_03960 [bacterium]|nr:hypothetical protein [bacterium]
MPTIADISAVIEASELYADIVDEDALGGECLPSSLQIQNELRAAGILSIAISHNGDGHVFLIAESEEGPVLVDVTASQFQNDSLGFAAPTTYLLGPLKGMLTWLLEVCPKVAENWTEKLVATKLVPTAETLYELDAAEELLWQQAAAIYAELGLELGHEHKDTAGMQREAEWLIFHYCRREADLDLSDGRMQGQYKPDEYVALLAEEAAIHVPSHTVEHALPVLASAFCPDMLKGKPVVVH